jgi:hypothetical protein
MILIFLQICDERIRVCEVAGGLNFFVSFFSDEQQKAKKKILSRQMDG